MPNTYTNQAVEDLVWSVIKDSPHAMDFLDFTSQFSALNSAYYWQALDQAVKTFNPANPRGVKEASLYPAALKSVQALAASAQSDEIRAQAHFNAGKMFQLGLGAAINRNESIQHYKKAMALGEIRSLINCGGLYDGEDATPEDLEFAHELYYRALAQGEPMGLVRIAERLDKKNDARRYALYLQAAEMGLPIALHRVGKAHYLGDLGQTEDKSLAISWLQRAARAGESEASVILGQHYDRSETEDEALAHEWRLLGAQQGSVFCMRVIGFHYLMDGEFGSDKEKAYYWLDRAAVQGDNKAQYLIGQNIYTRSEPPNPTLGLDWLKLSADCGNDYAAWRVTVAYRDGVGCEKSESIAHRYCEIAAKGGYPEAQGQLGLNYLYASGVERDDTQAYKWVNLCALQGDATGLHLLGLFKDEGIGCEKNEEEAFELFREASAKGNIDAARQLGECYYYGHGVEKDLAQAAVWYRHAAKQGQKKAMTDLGWILYEGEGVLVNYEEAFKWFTRAAEQDDPRGMYMLAMMYLKGDGVEASELLTRRWMSRAAMLGYAPATEWIEEHLPKVPNWLEQLVANPGKPIEQQPND